MAKDKPTNAETVEKKERKDKKEKKRKHSEVEGPAEVSAVSERKKEKKDKKRKSTDADGDAIMATSPGAEVSIIKDEDEDEKKAVLKVEVPLAALVPFANPLCDEKAQKKVLKSVKKAAKHKTLKRGVKECVKALRKSPLATPTTLSSNPTGENLPVGIVVLAADISPMDVISHIPVLCEDHDIPYVYVPSRAELGAAGSTKRPTSVVMLTPRAGDEEWMGAYGELHRLALKLGRDVRV